MKQNDLIIEPMSDGDFPALVALWGSCNLVVDYNDPLDDIAFARGKTNSDVLIGRVEGVVVASMMVGHDGHRGWLWYVAIDPSVQRQGLGGQIVKGGEDWLRKRGVRKAMLLIRDANTAVRTFYERIGYEAVPRTVMQRWL